MGDSSEKKLDFGFAFNNKDFSDRVLHIEIVHEDCLPPPNKKKNSFFSSKRFFTNKKREDSFCFGVKVVTLHISSPILAAKSPFFYKLFKNSMKESHQREVTMRIAPTEAKPLKDVFKFMYNNTLSATTPSDLLGVLMCADKFEVTSCMKYCIKVMLEGQMSLKSALLYLDLPSSLLASEIVQPLIDASKDVLVACYMDFNKFEEEAMALPLSAIQVVLGSDGLQVNSEDDVYDFILNWARAHYPKQIERREILTKHLTRFISFPHLSSSKLKKALDCDDFDHARVSKLVSEALFYNAEVPYGKHLHAIKSRRVYFIRPIKVVQLDFPWPRCVIYFNLKKDECVNLFLSKKLCSQLFQLGERWFYLAAQSKEESPHNFGLFVYRPKDTPDCTMDFELAVMNKSSKDFIRKLKCNNHTLGSDGWGMPNLLGISWTEFMSDKSEYFIDDILHLRVDLTLINPQV